MISTLKKKIKYNSNFYKVLALIFFYVQYAYFLLFQTIFFICPIAKRKILFVSYYGNGYGDSGKYVCNELLKNASLDIYWAYNSKHSKQTIPNGIKKVKFNSIKYLYHLSTANILINNTRFLYGIRKRKKQTYIQLWHGGIAMKKVEFDSNLSSKYYKTMLSDNKMIDIMISNGSFCTKMYKESFKYDGKIMEFGTPRNDRLIKFNKHDYIEIRKEFKYDKDVKILLYAPTFRTNYSTNPYDINFDKIKETLETRTSNKWIIMIRMHPLARNYDFTLKGTINVKAINVTDYPDMQKLISSCDILVTDYSSSMFEAMMIKKPVMLYAKDIIDYRSERGFYFDFNDLPFEKAYNSIEAERKLFELLNSNYVLKYSSFIKKIGLVEKGNASLKVCNLITKIVFNEKGNYHEKTKRVV